MSCFRVFFDPAMRHDPTVPGERLMNCHNTAASGMPGVTDFSRFDIIGVALLICIMRTGHISASRRTRQQVGLQKFALSLKAGFDLLRDSSACTIVMWWQRRLKSYPPEDNFFPLSGGGARHMFCELLSPNQPAKTKSRRASDDLEELF